MAVAARFRRGAAAALLALMASVSLSSCSSGAGPSAAPSSVVPSGVVGKSLFGWSGAVVPGVKRQLVGTWMARDTWADLAQGHWLAYSDDLTAFVKANPAGAADIGVPLIPHDQAASTWNALLTQAASGAQDATYTSLGANLAKEGPKTVYARLWWEFNNNPIADNIDRSLFRAAWAHAVPLIRAGFAAAAPGKTLKIVFCPNSDGADYAPFYPGDQFVDVVALDAYGAKWGTTTPSASEVLSLVTSQLNGIAAFASSHGKPVALGEWGNMAIGTQGVVGLQGRGDFPQYIDLVFDWAARVHAVYLSYFNIDAASGISVSHTPQTLTRLQARDTTK
jgi:hypothetical protein